jgi:hypothetical protein
MLHFIHLLTQFGTLAHTGRSKLVQLQGAMDTMASCQDC